MPWLVLAFLLLAALVIGLARVLPSG